MEASSQLHAQAILPPGRAPTLLWEQDSDWTSEPVGDGRGKISFVLPHTLTVATAVFGGRFN